MCGRTVKHYAAMALMKRSPNRTANWALAMDHSRGGIVTGEVAPGPDRPAELGIQGLDGIRSVDDPADLLREGEEACEHAMPGAW